MDLICQILIQESCHDTMHHLERVIAIWQFGQIHLYIIPLFEIRQEEIPTASVASWLNYTSRLSVRISISIRSNHLEDS